MKLKEFLKNYKLNLITIYKMESYFGFSANEWYTKYQEKGIDIFEDRNIEDSDILMLLGRCCTGFELITPTLKKAGWTLDRLIKAEKDYGIEYENLSLIVGEYLAMDKIDYKKMTPFEIRTYINSNYDLGTLSTQGGAALQNQRF